MPGWRTRDSRSHLRFANVRIVDSTGISLLWPAYTLSRKQGHAGVIRVRGEILELFRSMRLEQHLNISVFEWEHVVPARAGDKRSNDRIVRQPRGWIPSGGVPIPTLRLVAVDFSARGSRPLNPDPGTSMLEMRRLIDESSLVETDALGSLLQPTCG